MPLGLEWLNPVAFPLGILLSFAEFLIGVALGQRVAQARASGETVGEAEAAALRAELAAALRTTYPA